MSDISKIHLPDGNDYDVVAKKAYIPLVVTLVDKYVPIVVADNTLNDNKEMHIPNQGPTVNLKDGTVDFKQSIVDISSQYEITKTSGNWSVHEIQAYKCGNIVFANFILKGNGSSVSAGSNGFVGTITYGPLPILEAKLWTFSSSTIQSINITADGAITARNLIGSITFSSSTRTIFSGMFITND